MSRERQGRCPHGYVLSREPCPSCRPAYRATPPPLRAELDLATARADIQRLHRGLREIAKLVRVYYNGVRVHGNMETIARLCDALVEGKEIEELC